MAGKPSKSILYVFPVISLVKQDIVKLTTLLVCHMQCIVLVALTMTQWQLQGIKTMKNVKLYTVYVFPVSGGMRTSIETSLRACIALTYGLQCEWYVMDGTGESAITIANDGWKDKKWSHNVRAFRQTLPKFVALDGTRYEETVIGLVSC